MNNIHTPNNANGIMVQCFRKKTSVRIAAGYRLTDARMAFRCAGIVLLPAGEDV
jgi:hypothetical protein